jgi:MFS family permease
MTTHSPRTARIAIAVFFFISGFTFSTWASRIPAIQQEMHLDEAQLGAVLFALPAGLMGMLPVTGFLLRRFSSRNVMLAGALLFNVMLALLGFASHTWQLIIVLLCFGASRNLFNISLNAQSLGVQAYSTASGAWPALQAPRLVSWPLSGTTHRHFISCW